MKEIARVHRFPLSPDFEQKAQQLQVDSCDFLQEVEVVTEILNNKLGHFGALDDLLEEEEARLRRADDEEGIVLLAESYPPLPELRPPPTTQASVVQARRLLREFRAGPPAPPRGLPPRLGLGPARPGPRPGPLPARAAPPRGFVFGEGRAPDTGPRAGAAERARFGLPRPRL